MTDDNPRMLLDSVAIELEYWADHVGLAFGLERDRERAEEAARAWGIMNDARTRLGILTWDGILSLAMFRAIAEPDPKARRQRLIEMAAAALTAAV